MLSQNFSQRDTELQAGKQSPQVSERMFNKNHYQPPASRFSVSVCVVVHILGISLTMTPPSSAGEESLTTVNPPDCGQCCIYVCV